MCGWRVQNWLIKLANREGAGPKNHSHDFGWKWEWSGRARDDYVSVINDRKWPTKKRPVIAHIKASSKHSSLIINRMHLKKKKKANFA